MVVAIRSAALNDVPEILDMERQASSAAHWNAAAYMELVNNGVVLVAEETGKLRGFVCAKAIAGEWEIENVVVAGEFIRRGVASELMRGLIRRAQRESASLIRLEVRASNLPARALYLKHGFRESGLRKGYYNAPAEDAILYSLPLDR